MLDIHDGMQSTGFKIFKKLIKNNFFKKQTKTKNPRRDKINKYDTEKRQVVVIVVYSDNQSSKGRE
jgi:hypothetical protein